MAAKRGSEAPPGEPKRRKKSSAVEGPSATPETPLGSTNLSHPRNNP